MRRRLVAIAVLAVAGAWSCKGEGPAGAADAATAETRASPPATPTSPTPKQRQRPQVVFDTPAGEIRVDVDVARTPQERSTGLMHRRQMKPYQGMVFLFDDDRNRTFWMKNTYLPLDMIFIDKDFTVVGVVDNAEPLTLNPRSVGTRSRYVVEVNAGWCSEHGVAKGSKVRFEHVF